MSNHPLPLSNLEYHVLLALAEDALYGYALKEAVVEESGGALTPLAEQRLGLADHRS
jgi:DNA-binding PadR family transcriptional regulator